MKKPAAPRVMSGTFGTLFWNGEPVFEVNSFEAKLKVNRETITFAGEMGENSKLMGTAGEWSFKIKKIFSRGQREVATQIKKGIDPRMQFVGKVADPDAYGSERLVLSDCWFGDLTLMAFETGKVMEEEFSGGFADFDFPDTVAVQ